VSESTNVAPYSDAICCAVRSLGDTLRACIESLVRKMNAKVK
jgi:hypothetical protein